MDLAGGCLCGAVRYRSSGPQVRQFVCHCRDCQRSGGSVFHVGVVVPRAGFTITHGELRRHQSKADSGRTITRNFCPICGSGIINELEFRPDHVVIKIGTLDDPGLVIPTYEVFARSRIPWVSIAGEIETFEAMSPYAGQNR
jgi:hypothetical protein